MSYYLYVIELDKQVGKLKKFRKQSPNFILLFDIFIILFLIHLVFEQTNCSADLNEIFKGTATCTLEASRIEILIRCALLDFLNNTGPISGKSKILI